jgi:uncharacterized membrane protein
VLRVVAKITSPILYAAALVLIVFGPLYIASLPGMAWFNSCCSGLAFVLIFVAGPLLLAIFNIYLTRFEELQSPEILDHLRRCALLYVVLAVLAFLLVTLFESQTGGVETSGGYAGMRYSS